MSLAAVAEKGHDSFLNEPNIPSALFPELYFLLFRQWEQIFTTAASRVRSDPTQMEWAREFNS